jgi:hypothetical protein
MILCNWSALKLHKTHIKCLFNTKRPGVRLNSRSFIKTDRYRQYGSAASSVLAQDLVQEEIRSVPRDRGTVVSL